MSGDASRRNGRKGGKPKGVRWKATLDREAAREVYRRQVLAKMDVLVQKQVDIAEDGDGMMLRYLTDQVIGSPERQKVTTTTTTDASGKTTIVNELH